MRGLPTDFVVATGRSHTGFLRVGSNATLFKADFSRFSRPLMTRLGAVVTVVHYGNVARWQDCITFSQSHVIQHSPAAKFMCTQSGGRVGGKHCRKFNDFRKFQNRFKYFHGPFIMFKALKPSRLFQALYLFFKIQGFQGPVETLTNKE